MCKVNGSSYIRLLGLRKENASGIALLAGRSVVWSAAMILLFFASKSGGQWCQRQLIGLYGQGIERHNQLYKYNVFQ